VIALGTVGQRLAQPRLEPHRLDAGRPRNGRHSGQALAHLTGTERAGFEPAMEFNPHTRLAGECLQPLGHLSRRSGVSVA
jgi:hypothetical protein